MIKALFVDDMPDELLLLQYLTKKYNLSVDAEICSDSEKASALLKTGQYDLLVTDIKMPFIDGLALSKSALEANAGIKIIIVSGYGDFNYAKTAISLGVCEYLLKPVQPEDFYQTMEKMIRQIEEEKENNKLKNLRSAYSKSYILYSIIQSGSDLENKNNAVKGMVPDYHAVFLIKYPTAMSDTVSNHFNQELQQVFGQYSFICIHPHAGMDAVFIEGTSADRLPSAQEQLLMAENIVNRYSAVSKKPCWVSFGISSGTEGIRQIYGKLKKYLDFAIQYPEIHIFYQEMEFPDTVHPQLSSENDIVQNKIKTVRQYIYEHCEEDLTLDKLAGLIYVHPDYLSRIFKQVTGQKLSSFIKACRMEQAKIYLSETYMKITEISSKVGYPNCSYFCQVFSEYFGISPEKYRKREKRE